MIITKDGLTEIKANSAEEMFMDMQQVIGSFIAFCKRGGMPEDAIEKTMMEMVVVGFNTKGFIYDKNGDEI